MAREEVTNSAESGVRRAGGVRGLRLEQWVERNLYILLPAPAILILLVLTIFPTIFMFTMAFQKFNLFFVGDPRTFGVTTSVRF